MKERFENYVKKFFPAGMSAGNKKNFATLIGEMFKKLPNKWTIHYADNEPSTFKVDHVSGRVPEEWFFAACYAFARDKGYNTLENVLTNGNLHEIAPFFGATVLNADYSYAFTETGAKEIKSWWIDALAKKKDIMDAGIDTDDNTHFPDADEVYEDVLSDFYEFVDDEGDYYNCWGLTDNYDTEMLALSVGSDVMLYIEGEVPELPVMEISSDEARFMYTSDKLA